MEIYVKKTILVFNHDFVIYIDFPLSQLQTQQLMRSQIMSHKQ